MATEPKDAPPARATRDSLLQLAGGFMTAKLLFVASEVGLFTSLATGPATLDEVAARTGIAPTRLRVLADGMVALGVLERKGDRYQNGPAAASFLSGETPTDLRPVLRFWDRLNYPEFERLEEAVRTGRAQGLKSLSEEDQHIFSEGVEAIQAEASRAIASSYDFGRHQRVLDVGGGTGSWLLAILDRFRDLNGTLFELPMAAAVARKGLVDNPLAERVEVVAGDFFADSIPGGHDAVLIANVIHLFSSEHDLELLRRVRATAPAGARLLLADFWTDETHTQPPFAAIMAGAFLVRTGEGAVYSEEEARGWLEQTGWEALERRPLAGAISLLVAEARG
jgi:SAM-dependent methyltransferase